MRHAHRFHRVIAFAALAAALVLAAQLVSCSSKKKLATSAKLPPLSARETNQTFAAEIQEPRGVASVRPTKPSAVPALESEAVSNFALSHPAPMIEQLGPPPTVTTSDCSYTAKRLSAVLRNKVTGLPDDTPLCYVELQGRFAVRTPPSKQNRKPKPLQFTKSFQVYDARTGNLVLSGGFTQP
jgi:hypothetical protein